MTVSINLVPFGHIDSIILDHLKTGVNDIFHTPVILKESLPLPKQALNPYRNQYRAVHFLDILHNINSKLKTQNSKLFLGICDVDLYARDLNFIFGLANMTKRVAVVSFARLKPPSYGLYTTDDNLFLTRILKETIHELGHLYGLDHCPREECVMHFSNSLIDTDIKDKRFCGRCHSILIANR